MTSSPLLTVNADSDQDPDLVAIRSLFSGSKPLPETEAMWSRGSPLNRLIAPMTLRSFLAQKLNRDFCHFRGGSRRRLDEYFGIDELRRLITCRAIPLSSLRLVDRNRRSIEPGTMASGAVGSAEPALLMRHLFRDRGSLAVNSLDLFHPEVNRLASEFRDWTGQDVGINSYFTPGGSQTLNWHWDTHDVFVLQVEGEKRWHLHEPCFPLPLAQGHPRAWPQFNEKASKQVAKTVLKKGDVLYIPRGMPHFAQSLAGSDSLHLTVGLYPVTWYDLIETMLERALLICQQDIRFREPVHVNRKPGGEIEWGSRDDRRLNKLYTTLFKHLAGLSAAETYLDRRIRGDSPSIQMLDAMWGSLSGKAAKGTETVYRLNPIRYSIRKHPELFELRVSDKKIYLPIAQFPIFDLIRKKKWVSASELAEKFFRKADVSALIRVLAENCLISVATAK
jgi:ribosomal protein L16 Arg81 hydroxylase